MIALEGFDGLPGSGIELSVGMDGLRACAAIAQCVQVVFQLFHRAAA